MAYDRQLPVPYRRASSAVARRASGRPLPRVYLSGARKLRHERETVKPELLHGSRLKWLVSSLLVGSVGAVAIGLVLFGSLDPNIRQNSLVADLEMVSKDVFETSTIPQRKVEASPGRGHLRLPAVDSPCPQRKQPAKAEASVSK